MTQQQDPVWLGWLAAVVPGLALLWAFLQRFFSYVTREEFLKALDSKHQENQNAIAGINTKLDAGSRERTKMREDMSKVAQDVSYLRGKIQNK